MINQSKNSAPNLVRLAHPLAFSSYLKSIGAPTDKYFRQQRLPVHCQNPDHLVPQAAAWGLFESAFDECGPLTGWHVGRFVGDHNLSANLLQKVSQEPSLYQALQSFARLIGSESSPVHLGLCEREDEVAFFTHQPGMRNERGYQLSQGYQIEMYIALIRHFVGQRWVPNEIGLEMKMIPVELSNRFPEARILAQQQTGYITISRDLLHSSIKRIAPAVDAGNQSLVMADQLDFAGALREMMKGYLPNGYASKEFAASLMDCSSRTLLRRLSESGITYAKLMDELRYDLAKEMLRNDDMRIGEIGAAVGLNDPAHFTRMFRRMAGTNPKQFRRVATSTI